MSTKLGELTRERVIDSWERASATFESLKSLVEDYEEVFCSEAIPPINSNPKFAALLGNQVLEPNAKYKNQYKKVFNPKQILSPFTAS